MTSFMLPVARYLGTRRAWDFLRASRRHRAGRGGHPRRERQRRERSRGAWRDDHRDRNAHQHQTHDRRRTRPAITPSITAPGVYRVEGELVGSRNSRARTSRSASIRRSVWKSSLAVGQLEESVIVTGEAPMLQTDRTDTGRIIESTQITQMPLGFNRNFQALLITVPGASRPFRPHSEFYNSQESLSSNVNGQSRQVEQRAAGRRRQQRQRRQSRVLYPVGRGD